MIFVLTTRRWWLTTYPFPETAGPIVTGSPVDDQGGSGMLRRVPRPPARICLGMAFYSRVHQGGEWPKIAQ